MVPRIMTPIGLDERKKISIEILDAVSKFCSDNDISYSLGYGTLLGAVRHGGFIPWDDDIDIVMLREDYRKFEEIFPTILAEKFSLGTVNRDQKWPLPFGKVYNNNTMVIERKARINPIGVSIDVFPLDFVPENRFAYKLYRSFFKALCYCSRMKIYKGTRSTSLPKRFLAMLIKIALAPFSNEKIIRIINNKSQYLSLSKSSWVCYWPSADHASPIPVAWFSPLIKVTFEDNQYASVNNKDGYLKAMYGPKYMTPPPENKRISQHTNDAYWRNSLD